MKDLGTDADYGRKAVTTVLIATNHSQTVIAEYAGRLNRIACEPYGVQSADRPPQSRQGFNGELRETLLDGYALGVGYRFYNPLLRRFQGADELSPFEAGGLNGYGYCAGDPLNNGDPSGRVVVSWLQGWQTRGFQKTMRPQLDLQIHVPARTDWNIPYIPLGTPRQVPSVARHRMEPQPVAFSGQGVNRSDVPAVAASHTRTSRRATPSLDRYSFMRSGVEFQPGYASPTTRLWIKTAVPASGMPKSGPAGRAEYPKTFERLDEYPPGVINTGLIVHELRSPGLVRAAELTRHGTRQSRSSIRQ